MRLYAPAAAPPPRMVALASARLTASDAPEDLEALRDGRLDTFWSIAAGRDQRHWIEVAFAAPVRLGRIELLLGDRPADAGRGLSIEVTGDGERWQAHPCAPARPPTREQLPALGGWSEVLVCPEVETRALRIVRQAGARRWSVAELHVQDRARPE